MCNHSLHYIKSVSIILYNFLKGIKTMTRLTEFINWHCGNPNASEEHIKAMVSRLSDSDQAKLRELMSSEHIAHEQED